MIDPRLILLLAGCVLSGALLASQFYGAAEDGIAAKPAVTRSDDARPGPRAQPERADELLTAVLARPLFSPTRRPPETAQVASSELADKRLAGIVIEPDRRFAIFAVTGAKPLTVTEGESVDGWRIESITPTEISLVGPRGSRTLQPVPETAAARQSRPQRGNAGARSAAQPQASPAAAQPAQQAAVQPPGGAPRPPAPPGRAAGPPAAAPPATAPNRPRPGQNPPEARQNAPAASVGTVRPGPRQ